MNYQINAVTERDISGPMVRQTLRERLEEQRKTAQEFLNGIESAIKFIDQNPEFENFHNILGKVGF